MSTRRVADVIFCLDASASMQPCIQAVRRHIGDFVRGLHSDPQSTWDVRLDFVAHSASEDADATVFRQRSLHNESVVGALYAGSQSARFFTTDVEQFSRGLNDVEVSGNEAPLVALDTCLDFPWRDAAECHRVVILMTDEPLESGVLVNDQLQMLPAVIDKIQKLRVMLFIVAPPSDGFS
ncbi:MAG: VWA domain-containing protein, partial [Planctomycetes bacterium]|nr:VWA domain-containing protein [Planctomycetota bacterium]